MSPFQFWYLQGGPGAHCPRMLAVYEVLLMCQASEGNLSFLKGWSMGTPALGTLLVPLLVCQRQLWRCWSSVVFVVFLFGLWRPGQGPGAELLWGAGQSACKAQPAAHKNGASLPVCRIGNSSPTDPSLLNCWCPEIHGDHTSEGEDWVCSASGRLFLCENALPASVKSSYLMHTQTNRQLLNGTSLRI